MASEQPFELVPLVCKAPVKAADPGRILVFDKDPGNGYLVNCYLRACMNIGEAKNMSVRYNTSHKYLRKPDGNYVYLNHGVVYFRKPGITLTELESLGSLIHLQAEIIYNLVESQNQWSVLYSRSSPREAFP